MRSILVLSFGLFCFNLCGQHRYMLAFYNVENLFDTIDDPHVQDNEFLPGAAKKWNTSRYQTKLKHLSLAISSIDHDELPVIAGFCEVENRHVLEDLINQKELKNGNYAIVHRDSPDKRGIDCAVIYRRDLVKLEHITFKSVRLPNHKGASTRDIIVAKMQIAGKRRIYLLINHWPSRLGGEEESEANRLAVAGTVKKLCDSLSFVDPATPQILMGDFNDSPVDKSLSEQLGADTSSRGKSHLVNLTYPLHKKGLGSYFYKGHWEMLDNIIVSRTLLSGSRIKVGQAGIHRASFLLYKSKQGILSPSRTYSGKQYHGGYSDHLPVYIDLIF